MSEAGGAVADRAGPPPHVLREYALLADGERGVLVGPRGDFSWMCFPRWHDGAVFCALLGGRSHYTVAPRGRFVWGGYYEPGSLVWRSRWITEGAVVECREALALPSATGRAVVLRRVEVLDGEAEIDVALAAGAGFDRHGMAALKRADDGDWEARLGDERMRWTGAAEAEPAGEGRERELRLGFALRAGEHRDLVLVLERGGGVPAPADAVELWRSTEESWRRRRPRLRDTLAPRDADHACAVLGGLSGEAGGMVAAATASLPERAEQGRNYDYRFVWVRDQAFAGQAAAAAGADGILDDAVRFIVARLLDDGPKLMPAYTVAGEPVPSETEVALPGYPGGGDTLGNHVNSQFQLDAFGEALLLLAAAARADRLDGDGWRAAETAATAISERWQEPDAGIWELEPRRWTHSRLECAAGLRAIASHAPGRGLASRWLTLADELVADAAETGLHSSGRWQRAPEDERLDAALLTAAIRGALPAEDPRSLATLAAAEAELTREGYCYRFPADGLPLGEAEGAFLLCGFWLALANAQLGRTARAISWFERGRSACGPPGLLSEEFDVRQRQLRGNLPQAFVHALLLESAAALEREAGRAASPAV